MYGLPLGPEYGGFLSDAVRVPYADAMLVPIPDGVSAKAVASLSDNIPDAWRTVAPQLDAEPGAPVLICAGAGSIALYAAALAVALGAERVDFAGGRPASASSRSGSAPTSSRSSSRTGWARTRSPSTRASTTTGSRARFAPWSRTGSAPASGSSSSRKRRCRCSRCTRRGSASRPAAPTRPSMPRILDLVRQGRFEPELVTAETALWDEAPEAVAEHSAKLVISR